MRVLLPLSRRANSSDSSDPDGDDESFCSTAASVAIEVEPHERSPQHLSEPVSCFPRTTTVETATPNLLNPQAQPVTQEEEIAAPTVALSIRSSSRYPIEPVDTSEIKQQQTPAAFSTARSPRNTPQHQNVKKRPAPTLASTKFTKRFSSTPLASSTTVAAAPLSPGSLGGSSECDCKPAAIEIMAVGDPSAGSSRRKNDSHGSLSSNHRGSDNEEDNNDHDADHQHEAARRLSLSHNERRQYWEHHPSENEPPMMEHLNPAENEPPALQNSVVPPPNTILIVGSSSDPTAPAMSSVATSHRGPSVATASAEPNENDEFVKFCEALKKEGLEMVQQKGDGNCLFRAISLQVYGQADSHMEVRERCMDFMAGNEEHYSNFVSAGSDDEDDNDATRSNRSTTATAPFQAYIARKRKNGVHGNHAEIQALSELFNRPVEVYTPETMLATTDKGSDAKTSRQPMNIFHAEYKTSDPPIRLSYHDGNHYNAIIDPLKPTAGVGLGLPGLQPGLADQMQVTKAKAESDHLADEMELNRVLQETRQKQSNDEDNDLQRVLKESSMDFMYKQKAMALSDLDATNYEMEQKVLASSMESYLRQEHGRKQRASTPSSALGRRRRASPSPMTPSEPPSSFAAFSPVAAAAAAALPENRPAAAASMNNHHHLPEQSNPRQQQQTLRPPEEYPQSVQELVMNGFELPKVVHAYDLIGDNFDDLLSFLLSSNRQS